MKDYVYDILRERPTSCTYAPRSILNEAYLTSEMKPNRIPMREVVSHLGTEGLVRVIPKRGTHATDILLSDVFRIFQIRTEFEPIILRLSASRLPKDELLYFIQHFKSPGPDDTVMGRIRLDTAVHLLIVEHCRDRYMVGIVHRVYDISSRIIFFIHQNHAAIHDGNGENLETFRLLLDRDLETAIKRMRVHVEHCRMAALNCSYTVPDGEAPVKTYRDKLYKEQKTAPHPYR